jgi:hypothetical protein
MREIPLRGRKGKGLSLLVDDQDYDLMSRYKWYAKEDRDGSVYAQTWLSAHHLLMPRMLVDHANGDKLDNTRVNLREATPRQNSMNRGLRSDSKNQYKGIQWAADRKKFRARIQVGDKRIWSRYYDSPVDAARAYDALARKHYGEFARLNFPDEPNYEPPPQPVRRCARPDCGAEFQFRYSNAIYCSRRCAKVMSMRAFYVRQRDKLSSQYWSGPSFAALTC